MDYDSEIERTLRLFFCAASDSVGIDHRGFQVTVSEEFLDSADVVIGLQQVAGETVTKAVSRSPFADLRLFHGVFDRLLDMTFMQMIAPVFAGILLCAVKCAVSEKTLHLTEPQRARRKSSVISVAP